MAAKKIKILIIDDEKDFIFFIKTNLEMVGAYKVAAVSSGRWGIWTALWYRPDLILLDITMPVMDGFAVLKELKRREATMGIPVIMLTARDEDAYKVKAAGLYDEDYIVKPVRIDFLKTKIENALARLGKFTAIK